MTRRARRGLGAVALAAGLGVALLLWPGPPPGPTGGWIAAAGLEARFESVGGLRLRYLRAGSGPPVVLIHGFGSSLFTWKDVLPALAREHDVVALDLPGFGGSDLPEPLGARQLPEAVLGLMDRLGLARAALVGHSMGGAAAAFLAATRPERIERLVLIDAAAYRLSRAARPAFLRALALPPVGAVLEQLPPRRATVRAALRQVFADDSLVTPERVEEYFAPAARPGALRAARELLASGDAEAASFETLVPRVRARTLVVWGREDAWIPVEDAARFGREIPGARVVILDRCGHMPQEERPAEVLRLLRDFLAG